MYKIHDSWKKLFNYYDIGIDIDKMYENGEVYPPKELVFRVFEMDVKEIRILILGQDPYHGPNQAHGLSFSVPDNQKIPPSLRNIFKELNLEFPERNYHFNSGNLEQWFTREKIFLLNSSLTVEKGKAGSHMKIWENFTNEVIKFISEQNDNCVFLLLGNYAKSKSVFIKNKSKIVTETHPSPLARGFIGSNIFKRVEHVLEHQVNWSISTNP
jgi:uracil-DNA glycosylase